jgi:large subunit ribosomal protein L28
MARQCVTCGKKTVFGRNISHAHNVTNRTMEPNLQPVRALIDGKVRRVQVCTRCLRSGLITKAPVRTWKPEEGATATSAKTAKTTKTAKAATKTAKTQSATK